MFESASAFNNGEVVGSFTSPLAWDTGNVTYMNSMFRLAISFNQYIGDWNTSSVTDMSSMFESASAFNNGQSIIQNITGTPLLAFYTDSTATLTCYNASFITDVSLNDGIVISTSAGLIYSSQINSISSNNALVMLTPYGSDISSNTITSIQKIPTHVGGTAPLSSWNTENVQNMQNMFQNALSFNQNIGGWNSTNVTDMESMFTFASSFNNGSVGGLSDASLNSWNTGKVTSMNSMFRHASAFNQSIGNWDTHSVTDMGNMFETTQFNQSLTRSGNIWNTGMVTSMTYMFNTTSAFNQDIRSWDVSKVTNFSYMFYKALAFNNGDLGNTGLYPLTWTTSSATRTRTMFYGAANFNQDISSWDVSNVTSMTNMFGFATKFNNGNPLNTDANSLSSWKSPKCTSFSGMFTSAIAFNQNVSNLVNTLTLTDPSGCDLSYMFSTARLFDNGQTGTIDISGNILFDAFYNNTTKVLTSPGAKFLTDLSSTDVLIITIGPISSPTIVYTSQIQSSPIVSDVSLVLLTAYGANLGTVAAPITSIKKQVVGSAPLNTWNTSNVRTIEHIFQNATYFNQRVDQWSTSKVTNMDNAFASTTSTLHTVFNNGQLAGSNNGLLNNWNTGNVTSMFEMFRMTTGFNQYISGWDVSKVTNMGGMFYHANVFNNGDSGNFGLKTLDSWTAPFCSNFSLMFQQAPAFNQNVSNLVYTTGLIDPSGCDLSSMFQSAALFNNGITTNIDTAPLTWKTENVTSMKYTFNSASSFNQYIGDWNTARVTDMTYMFQTARLFDNGETGTMDISGNPYGTPFTGAFYLNSTRVLTSPNSKFIRDVSSTDVLIITYGPIAFPTIVYTSKIQSISSDVSLVLFTAYGSDISSNQITSIKKQVVGTRPMSWNTSIQKPDMQYMFSDATYFNQDVSSFTVSNATHMFSSTSTALRGIFNNGQLAGSNNNSLLNWNTVASGSIGAMFLNSAGFNQNISKWNVSNVGYTGQMFQGALVYNNGQAPGVVSNDSSLNSWNTSNFTDIQIMFNGAAAFNQNVSNWDVSKVTTMNATFSGATLFNNGDTPGSSNQPLTNWYAPKSRDFATMFISAVSFNQSIPNLVDTSGIILDASGNGVTMDAMFQSATTFNKNLSGWNTSKVSIMSSVFSSASVFNNGDASGANNQPLNWITDNVNTMSNMFVNAIAFNQPINTNGPYWNTGKVTTMFQMFAKSTGGMLFNQPIGNWDTGNVTTMNSMFYGSSAFNQPISLWKTGNVNTMFRMFGAATSFNQTINTDASGSWNVSKVTDMSSMFSGASAFNNGGAPGTSLISLNWYAPNCLNFSSMFLNSTVFNQPIPFLVDTSGLVLPLVASIGGMFQATTVFNQDVSGWNVSNVTDMTNVFRTTTVFNQNLNNWNVGNATNMTNMFQSAVAYNNGGAPLTWYAPKCTNFTSMFQSTVAFNQPISTLVDTSGIAVGTAVVLNNMFQTPQAFNQNISNWNVSKVTSMNSMFINNGIFNNGEPSGNSGTLLNSWSAPYCTDFTSTFSGASAFNQSLINLVSLFLTSTNITGVIPATSSYTNSTKTLNCPGATFTSALVTGKTIIIRTASITYVSAVQSFTDATNIVLTVAYGADIPSNITSIYISKTLASMFSAATKFNQNLNNWSVSNVTAMNSIFSGATAFNNGAIGNVNNNPLTWSAPNCSNFTSMFQSAIAFNQVLPNLVNSSGIIIDASSNGVTLASMFNAASIFNNGEINTISTITPQTCISAVNTLICPGASLLSQVSVGDALLIPNVSRTSAFVVNTVNVISLNISPAIGTNAAGQIFNVQKVIPITSTLPSVTPSTSFYTNATKTLTCPGATFTTAPLPINVNDTLWVVTALTVYITTVQSITATALVVTGFGTDIAAPGILNIQKPPAGTADLSWNTINVTSMNNMFRSAPVFNQSLRTFDTRNVTGLGEMFRSTGSFNQPLSTFDTRNVIDIGGMFNEAKMFNQPINTNGIYWNTSNITNMGSLFQAAQIFNQSLSLWNTSKVTLMNTMFYNAYLFNQPLITVGSVWDVSGVTNMNSIFNTAQSFNKNLNSWNVSKVTNFGSAFFNATMFNNGSASNDSANPLIWNAPLCVTFNQMFARASAFNQTLDDLVNTSDVSSCDLGSMFLQTSASTFNKNLNSWNVSKVTNFGSAFFNATMFNNGSASNDSANPLIWNAPLCVTFNQMFARASAFNQTLDDLVNTSDVSSCDLGSMFLQTSASTFNKNLNSWNVSNVTSMGSMFNNTTSFNNGGVDLSWNAPKVVNFASMFQSASAFNRAMPTLVDTSGIIVGTDVTLASMFQSNPTFNQNLNTWNVSKVTDMSGTFVSAPLFNNGDISGNSDISLNWSAPYCTNFTSTFSGASAFNQKLDNLVSLFPTTSNITGVIPATSSYTNLTKTLNCPGAVFTSALVGRILIIRTASITYVSAIQSFTDATNIVLTVAYGANINAPNIQSIYISKSLASMFQSTTKFNQTLNTWCVSNVTAMNAMFQSSTAFNNGGVDLSWNARNCLNFTSMFQSAPVFNRAISNLVDTSGIIVGTDVTLTSMFQSNPTFNQNLNTWYVSKVTAMNLMFSSATNFNNGDASGSNITTLNTWSAPYCTNFSNMFANAPAFNQKLDNLVSLFPTTSNITGVIPATSSYTNLTRTLNCPGAVFTAALVGRILIIRTASITYISNVQTFTNATNIILTTPYGSDIPSNNIISIYISKTLTSMFSPAIGFNQNLNNWSVSNVTAMNLMFSGATIYNNGNVDLSWNAPNCVNFASMFQSAPAFNRAISSLVDTSGVTIGNTVSLASMFQNTSTTLPTIFNQNISNWNVSRVTTMASMFNRTAAGAIAFNNGSLTNDGSNNLNNWRAPLCTTFTSMFQNNLVFNQAITNLVDTSSVATCTMDTMFSGAYAFNNGQVKPADISGTVTSGSYTNSTATLNVPLATFITDLSVNNVLTIATGTITSPTIIYTSQIQRIITNTSLVLVTPYGADILTGITSIKKQVVGNSDLSWNTTNVTTMVSMFQNAYYFNQNISNWSTSKVTTMALMFSGPSTLLKTTFNNGQLAGLGNVSLNWTASRCTTFASMFLYNAGFNQAMPYLVDVSCITLTSMFQNTSVFNQNISSWNVSRVNNMSSMFSAASAFNNGGASTDTSGNTLTWYAPNCTTFESMFGSNTAFNQPIPFLVDTSNIALPAGSSLTLMFYAATKFNQNINSWNVSRVTTMNNMFNANLVFNNGGASIDTSGNTLTWYAPACTNFASMFNSSTAFNQPIPFLVDTSNVTLLPTGSSLSFMFSLSTKFNQNINSWNVSRVNNMSLMFSGASAFNNGGASIDTSGNTLTWYAPLCTTFASMFGSNTAFNQPIPFLVDTSNAILLPSGSTLSSMFQNTTKFNQNISSWNVSRVNNMSLMFSGASAFNNGSLINDGSNNLNNWNAPLCTTFASMFSSSTAFNQPLTNLVNTSSVATCTMDTMFSGAYAFNNGQVKPADISGTVTSGSYTNSTATLNVPLATFITDLSVNNVLTIATGTITSPTIIYTSQIQRIITNTSLVLVTPYGADILTGITSIKKQVVGNSDLSWNTTNVTTMVSMFQNAYYFNQNISNWSTSKVTTMALMFSGPSTLLKTTFNNGQLAGLGNVSLNWTASRCTTFASMFLYNAGFNQAMPYLVDVSCTTLTSMFQNTSVFNQNISSWNTSNVTTIAYMFQSAGVFNNGQTGTVDISGNLNTSSATYTNSSKLLFCPGGNFTTLTSNDALIITTSTIVYLSKIQTTPVSDVSLVLLTAYGANILSGITSIKKQVAGTAPLNWNTSSLQSMNSTFYMAPYFNQQLPWNVSNVTDMTQTFAYPSFSYYTIFNNGQLTGSSTQPLTNALVAGAPWTPRKCTLFQNMFAYNLGFNQPMLNFADISGVTSCNFQNMFASSLVFNQNLSSWNVSNASTMANMFANAPSFNNGSAPGLSDASLNWYAPKCTSFANMFSGTSTTAPPFNQPIPYLVDSSGVTSCSLVSMFEGNQLFNQNLNSWNVSRVTAMDVMFSGTPVFNNGDPSGNSTKPLTNWRSPLCVSFSRMFATATSFNQAIPYLVDVSCTTLTNMFNNASTFNQNISTWNTNNVTSMDTMFFGAYAFNNGQTGTQDISGNAATASYTDSTVTLSCPGAVFTRDLSVNNVLIITSGTITSPTIIYTSQIQRIISDTSLVLLTSYGSGATNIATGAIGTIKKQVAGTADLSWNTTNVTTMLSMFNTAYYFNQNISNWNVSKVTTMASMFTGTNTGTGLKTIFNNGQLAGSSGQQLNWRASRCTTFASMFFNTSGFNQPIPTLVDVSCTTLANMFQNASVFNQNLSSWTTSNVTTFTSAFQSARVFNNGQSVTQTVRGTPSLASNAVLVLTCPDASFNLDFSLNDGIIITTGGSAIYSSIVASITSNTILNLSASYPLGLNLGAGVITSIKKQVVGSAQLLWNTQTVTNITSIFNGATYFNQQLPWNTRKVTNVTTAFIGTAAFINLFNNGQITGGATQKLYPGSGNTWDFSNNSMTGNTLGAWRANSRLVVGVTGNGVTINPVFT